NVDYLFIRPGDFQIFPPVPHETVRGEAVPIPENLPFAITLVVFTEANDDVRTSQEASDLQIRAGRRLIRLHAEVHYRLNDQYDPRSVQRAKDCEKGRSFP